MQILSSKDTNFVFVYEFVSYCNRAISLFPNSENSNIDMVKAFLGGCVDTMNRVDHRLKRYNFKM